MALTRRSFLRRLASGLLVAAAAPVVAEPFVRRVWQVGLGDSLAERRECTRHWDAAEAFLDRERVKWDALTRSRSRNAELDRAIARSYLGEDMMREIEDEPPALSAVLPERPRFDFYRELLARDPIAQAALESRVTYETLGLGQQGRVPIGTLESIDHETGTAVVRLGAPLVGWRGTIVA